MLSKYVVSFFLLFTLIAHAEELKEGEVLAFEHNGQKWTAHYIAGEETDQIKIQESVSKTEMTYASDSRAHGLVSVQPLIFDKGKNILFATVWSKGAHGETIRVFNPKLGSQEKAQLFYYHSAWPLEFKIEDGQLVINGKGDMDDNGNFLDEIRVFKP